MLVKIRQADGSFYTLKLLRGPRGEKGEQGDPGTGLVIRDAFDTEEALRAAHPTGEPGESYTIGDVVYTWSESLGDWKAIGSLVGPAGKDGENGKDGSNGQDGNDGSDGVGILSVEQTVTSTADGGENIVTITLTDGTTFDISIRNGSKGSRGATGATPTSFPASAITGTLGLTHGGTGVTSLAALKTALGISDAAGFVTGTYVGKRNKSSAAEDEISLGFKPSFVLVWCQSMGDVYCYSDASYDPDEDLTYVDYQSYVAFALPDYPATDCYNGGRQEVLVVTSGGFKVSNYYHEDTTASAERWYQNFMNKSGETYCYIAGK